ncbi:MAG: DNA (cytosine-5-)-methyltransferase, partial [Chloroflexi bacterium]|nr:DNA (cytosine-5-)-methyltransferase [Chloroflexota bacterium]
RRTLPPIDLVVGGFPCQDYSVSRILSQAIGIKGSKGVLWWEIERFLRIARPRYLFLENVDRLLRSPAHQRGRDFGVMLGCLAALGYTVEWRVVNAADYGFAQRRRRTFIVGRRIEASSFGSPKGRPFDSPTDFLLRDGVLARALPAGAEAAVGTTRLPEDLVGLSDEFAFEFENAGVMHVRDVWTVKVAAQYGGPRQTLGEVLLDENDVAREYFVPRTQLKQWRYLKGAKSEARAAKTGFRYFYTEGPLSFPEPLDQPSRTILTGEGGSSPSRFKHVVRTPSGKYRRLTPVELERLNGFPDGWTDTGMPEGRRAFCMGNALVVGLVHRIARELASDAAVRAAA